MKDSFYGVTRSELDTLLDRPQRSSRALTAVYRQGIRRFEEVSAIPAASRERLAERFDLSLPAIDRRFDSEDGTRRYLLRLRDGEVVESALIPEADRVTFCISTQVGCALGCTFCLTAQLGLVRSLSAAEIVSQVVTLDRDNRERGGAARTSIVFMGMGEPLDNYDQTMKAIRVLEDRCGLGLPLSRITLSTVGLVPGIRRLASEPLFPNLSISLTGARNAVRSALMPINRKYPIEEVLGAVRDFPPARQKRVMLEYVLIEGLTDAESDARDLVQLLDGLRIKVNLIPLNPAPEIPYARPSDSAIRAFQRVLTSSGVFTFIRRNRGGDVSSACGQLKRKTVIA